MKFYENHSMDPGDKVGHELKGKSHDLDLDLSLGSWDMRSAHL